jgi:hypothetical protein
MRSSGGWTRGRDACGGGGRALARYRGRQVVEGESVNSCASLRAGSRTTSNLTRFRVSHCSVERPVAAGRPMVRVKQENVEHHAAAPPSAPVAAPWPACRGATTAGAGAVELSADRSVSETPRVDIDDQQARVVARSRPQAVALHQRQGHGRVMPEERGPVSALERSPRHQPRARDVHRRHAATGQPAPVRHSVRRRCIPVFTEADDAHIGGSGHARLGWLEEALRAPLPMAQALRCADRNNRYGALLRSGLCDRRRSQAAAPPVVGVSSIRNRLFLQRIASGSAAARRSSTAATFRARGS